MKKLDKLMLQYENQIKKNNAAKNQTEKLQAKSDKLQAIIDNMDFKYSY